MLRLPGRQGGTGGGAGRDRCAGQVPVSPLRPLDRFLRPRPSGRIAPAGDHGGAGSASCLRTLVLRKPEPKTIKIEGPDGQPVAGVRVSPLSISFAARGRRTCPTRWPSRGPSRPGRTARRRSTISRPETYWSPCESRPSRSARRTSSSSNGPAATSRDTTITIRLKQTSRLAGRVRNRAGEPVADQVVEVWSKGGQCSAPNPVEFKNGPLRTAADGSFQTPDNLLVGSSYRVVVRAPGMEPILSDWITIGEQPRVLLPMIQRPLRTLSGRVVDRQGKPLAGVEVFQSGDGPERTATKPMRTAGSRWAAFARARCSSSRAVRGFGSSGD